MRRIWIFGFEIIMWTCPLTLLILLAQTCSQWPSSCKMIAIDGIEYIDVLTSPVRDIQFCSEKSQVCLYMTGDDVWCTSSCGRFTSRYPYSSKATNCGDLLSLTGAIISQSTFLATVSTAASNALLDVATEPMELPNISIWLGRWSLGMSSPATLDWGNIGVKKAQPL